MSSMKSESESHWVMSDFLWPHGLYSPWNSAGPNTGVGSLPLLQGIFPTQGSNPGLLHCRWILYQLSHKGSLMTSIALPYAADMPSLHQSGPHQRIRENWSIEELRIFGHWGSPNFSHSQEPVAWVPPCSLLFPQLSSPAPPQKALALGFVLVVNSNLWSCALAITLTWSKMLYIICRVCFMW